MITKEQALEFLYELSQKHEVIINSYIGTLKVKSKDYDIYYDTPAIDKGLEGAVQEFIKLYPEIVEKAVNNIPVDVDMLEVGQTYKVVFNEVQITDKLTKIDDNNVYFRLYYPIKISSIREIYKVNEHANMQ